MRARHAREAVGDRDERRRVRCRTRSSGRRWFRTTAGPAGRRLATIASTRSTARTAARRLPASSARKATATLRTVEGHRVLRQRGHRLPQQQRARHDDHARRRRESRRSRDAAGARHGRRGRRPHRRRSASADHGVALDAAARLRSWSTTATSVRPSRAPRASATASSSPTTTAPNRG